MTQGHKQLLRVLFVSSLFLNRINSIKISMLLASNNIDVSLGLTLYDLSKISFYLIPLLIIFVPRSEERGNTRGTLILGFSKCLSVRSSRLSFCPSVTLEFPKYYPISFIHKFLRVIALMRMDLFLGKMSTESNNI